MLKILPFLTSKSDMNIHYILISKDLQRFMKFCALVFEQSLPQVACGCGCAARPKRIYRPHLGIYFHTTDKNSNWISQNTLSNRHTGMNVYTIFRLLAYSEILGAGKGLPNLHTLPFGNAWFAAINLSIF